MANSRVTSNRRVLVWAHILVGTVSAALYVNCNDAGVLQFTRAYGNGAVPWLVAVILLPYVISAIYSLSVVTDNRIRLWIFLFVLAALSACSTALLVGTFGVQLDGQDLTELLCAQVVALFLCSAWLLNVGLK
jgi:hypothetical protein